MSTLHRLLTELNRQQQQLVHSLSADNMDQVSEQIDHLGKQITKINHLLQLMEIRYELLEVTTGSRPSDMMKKQIEQETIELRKQEENFLIQLKRQLRAQLEVRKTEKREQLARERMERELEDERLAKEAAWESANIFQKGFMCMKDAFGRCSNRKRHGSKLRKNKKHSKNSTRSTRRNLKHK